MAQRNQRGTFSENRSDSPRKRLWQNLPLMEAPLLAADRHLQKHCWRHSPTIAAAELHRGSILRALFEHLQGEFTSDGRVVADFIAFEHKRQTGRDTRISEERILEYGKRFAENRETLHTWCERLGISMEEHSRGHESLGPLLEEIAHASVRWYGVSGLDRIVVRCTIADLNSRVNNVELELKVRMDAEKRLSQLLGLAVPLVRRRVIDLESRRNEVERIRRVIAEAKRPRERDKGRWRDYEATVVSLLQAKLPEIPTDTLLKAVASDLSAREMALEIVGLMNKPPMRGTTLGQLLKQREAGPQIPLAVSVVLQRP